MAGLFIDIFLEYFFRVLVHGLNLVGSRKWPITKATALSADCPLATCGCAVATVYYEYAADGEQYGDTFSVPFLSRKTGEDYAALFTKGVQFKVRVKPGDPATSIALWGPSAL